MILSLNLSSLLTAPQLIFSAFTNVTSQLRPQHPPCTPLRVNLPEQRHSILPPPLPATTTLRRDTVHIHRLLIHKLHLRPRLIYLLQKETRNHTRGRLVEIMPYILNLLHLLLVFVIRFLPDEQMPLPLLAPLDLHELVKLEHSSLAARPAFGSFVKYGMARVMCAFFVIAGNRGVVRDAAGSTLAD